MRYAVRSSDLMPDILENPVILDWLRVGDTESEKDSTDRLIQAAMFWAEGICGQPLFERTYTAELSDYRGGYLPGINPRNVKVDYVATNGTVATWGPFTEPTLADAFYVQQTGYLRFLLTLTRPLFGSYSKLTYTAGYNEADLPADIGQALLLVVYEQYDNRSNPVSERVTAAERLLQPYKIYTV